MAYLVYNNESPLQGGLLGLSATAEGLAEGEAFKEGKRQFNEEMSLKRDSFAETQIQWDEDMEHKYTVLRQAKEEGKLNRDQQERFARMDDNRAREMQKAELDFNVFFAKKVQQPFQADQNEKDRFVTKRGQSLQYSEGMDRNRKTFQAEMTRIEETRRQSQSTAGTAITIGTEVLGDTDFHALTTEQQAAVVDRGSELLLGVGRMRGAEGVVQSTPAEVAAAKDQMLDVLANLPARKSEFLETQRQLATQSRMASNAMSMEATGSIPFGTVADTPEWKQLGLGVKDRDPRSIPPDDMDKHHEILAIMGEIRGEASSGGWNDRGLEVVEAEYWPQVQAKIQEMRIKDKSVQDYYQAMFANVLYPRGADASLMME